MSTKKLRHPWLDAKDPANCVNSKGFWVPTLEEIEKACALTKKKSLRARRSMLWGDNDERKHFRLPAVFTLPNQREQIADAPQLCDCPYWGTEFDGR